MQEAPYFLSGTTASVFELLCDRQLFTKNKRFIKIMYRIFHIWRVNLFVTTLMSA